MVKMSDRKSKILFLIKFILTICAFTILVIFNRNIAKADSSISLSQSGLLDNVQTYKGYNPKTGEPYGRFPDNKIPYTYIKNHKSIYFKVNFSDKNNVRIQPNSTYYMNLPLPNGNELGYTFTKHQKWAIEGTVVKNGQVQPKTIMGYIYCIPEHGVAHLEIVFNNNVPTSGDAKGYFIFSAHVEASKSSNNTNDVDKKTIKVQPLWSNQPKNNIPAVEPPVSKPSSSSGHHSSSTTNKNKVVLRKYGNMDNYNGLDNHIAWHIRFKDLSAKSSKTLIDKPESGQSIVKNSVRINGLSVSQFENNGYGHCVVSNSQIDITVNKSYLDHNLINVKYLTLINNSKLPYFKNKVIVNVNNHNISRNATVKNNDVQGNKIEFHKYGWQVASNDEIKWQVSGYLPLKDQNKNITINDQLQNGQTINTKQPFIYMVNNQIVTNTIQGFNNSGYGHISINSNNSGFTVTLSGQYNAGNHYSFIYYSNYSDQGSNNETNVATQTVSGVGSNSAQKTVNILNGSGNISVTENVLYGYKMEKIDNIGNPLKGAVFEMTGPFADGKNSKTFTSNSNGIVIFKKLKPDCKYVFREIKAPKGYKLNNKGYTVYIDNNGKLDISKSNLPSYNIMVDDQNIKPTIHKLVPHKQDHHKENHKKPVVSSSSSSKKVTTSSSSSKKPVVSSSSSSKKETTSSSSSKKPVVSSSSSSKKPVVSPSSSSSEKSNKLINNHTNSSNSVKSGKSNGKNSKLPQTGDNNQNIIIVLGIIVVSVGLVPLIKMKH